MNKWNKFLTGGELKTVGIVACLNDKQQFLVIRRSNIDDRAGQWTMPGGHIDDEDLSIEAGAVRELKEEAGLVCNISDFKYLGVPKPDKYMFMTQKTIRRRSHVPDISNKRENLKRNLGTTSRKKRCIQK